MSSWLSDLLAQYAPQRPRTGLPWLDNPIEGGLYTPIGSREEPEDPGFPGLAGETVNEALGGPVAGLLELARDNPLLATAVAGPGVATLAQEAPVGLRDTIRGEFERTREGYLAQDPAGARPWAAFLTEVAANAMPVTPAAVVGRGVAGAARVAPRLAAAVAGATEGVLEGTLIGAGAGYTEGQSLGETARNAALGGGLGSLLGGLGGIAGGARVPRRPDAPPIPLRPDAPPDALAPPPTPPGATIGGDGGPGDSLLGGPGRPGEAQPVPADPAGGGGVRPGLREARLSRARVSGEPAVPLPDGPLYRGEAVDAPADAGPSRSHLAGRHYAESRSYAELHAEKYGSKGRVVETEVAVERPFSVEHGYSYEALRAIDERAALRAGRELEGGGFRGGDDEEIPGAAFNKALRDEFLEGQGKLEAPSAEDLAAAVKHAGRRLREAGFDGYFHLVDEPAKGKVRAWAVFGKGDTAAAASAPVPLALGNRRTLVTLPQLGDKVGVRWAVIDADDLQPSHITIGGKLEENPRYPHSDDIQPRDRERAASEEQVENIARNLDPDQLVDSIYASDGAPILSRDGFPLSGNARSEAIRRRYGWGTADEYRKRVIAEAEGIGLGERAAGMKRPVLVRVLDDDIDLVRFTRGANKSTVASYSPSEQAAQDAGRLTPATLELFVPNDSNSVATASNAEFVRAVLAEIAPGAGERAALMGAHGELNKDGVARVERAILARAYPDADLLARVIEDADSNIRTVGRALLVAAPRIAGFRAAVDAGARHVSLDLAGDLSLAAAKLADLRSSRLTSVDDWLKQPALMASGGEELTDTARELVRIFHENRRSANRLSAILHRYTELADEAGDPRQGGLFGPVEPPGKLATLRRAEEEHLRAGERALFEQAVEVTIPDGEGGFVRIPAGVRNVLRDAFVDIGDRLGRVFASHGDFQPLGRDAAPVIAEKARLSRAATATEQREATYNSRRLADGVKRYVEEERRAGRKATVEGVLQDLSAAIEGKRGFGALPPEVVGPAVQMRAHLDRLTDAALLEFGRDLPKALRLAMEKNKGAWLRRTYEAIHNPDWVELVKAPGSPEHWRWTGFIDELQRADPQMPTDVAEGIANQVLNRDPEVFVGLTPRTGVPRIKYGSLRARKSLTDAATDLLGLHDDPSVRYGYAVMNLAYDIEAHRVLRDIKARVGATLFHTQPAGEAYVRLEGRQFGPLNGLHTTPEVAAVIKAGLNRNFAASEFGAWWVKATSAIKYGKTVGSFPQTHLRNFGSWGPMLLMGGHGVAALSPRRWARSAATVGSDLAELGPGLAFKHLAARVQLVGGRTLADVIETSAKGWQDRRLKLTRLGVLNESPAAGDVKHYRGVLGTIKSLKPWKNERALHAGGRVLDGLEWLYGAEDDLGKVVFFEAERANLEWANPQWSPARLDQEAANRTRLTSPTYSFASPATRWLRDMPLLASFPTFSQEVLRTFKNNFKIAAADLRSTNPRMKVLGAKRAGGMIAALSLPTAALWWAREMLDVKPEEEDAVRELGAPWERSSDVLVAAKGQGEVQFVDLSFMYPFALLREPFIAALAALDRGDGAIEAAIDAAWQIGEPFLGKEILVDGIVDYIARTEGELWDRDKPPAANAKTLAAQVYRTVAPGTVLWIERMLRARQPELAEGLEQVGEPELADFIREHLNQYTPYSRRFRTSEEVIAALGPRVRTIPIGKSMYHVGRDLSRAFTDARREYRQVANHPGGMPPRAILSAERQSEEMWRESWDRAHRRAQAGLTLLRAQGFTDAEAEARVVAGLREGGVSEADAWGLVGGRFDAQRVWSGIERRRR